MLAATIAIAPLNHLLRGASWARKRLTPLAGKTVGFCIPPFSDLAVTIQASGEVLPALAAAIDSPADTTLTLTPGLLPRLLARNEDAYREIQISGDEVLAAEILDIAKNLRWDVEQDLSRVTGDILAHRMVQTGTSMVQWHTETARNLSQTLVEYWTEEQPLLAKPTQIREFTDAVSALQDDMAQLEKRVKKLNKPRKTYHE